MNNRIELSEKWIKASIVGTIWAASEIVLGSFLHNLRIPLSSNVLTAIGIIVLISTSFKWTEKGLFWRAGLICALMKTVSPSAVIFGPMIAIFCQALLLEIFTRLLGKNILGYALGAMFAMLWNLFHVIMNYIIYYGFNIVNIYSGLLKYAQKQLNFHFDLVWSPIIFLAVIYASLGLAAAVIGIKVGKKLLTQSPENILYQGRPNNANLNAGKQTFKYSIRWLCLDIAFIITAFILLNNSSWIVWSSSIAAIAIIWVLRYKRALRQLSRPRFWIYFIVITMVTAFVFNKIQSQDFVNGLLAGIQMNFRSLIVILGFSVLGTELYNPRIRDFFSKTAFKQLPLALELSFESLPLIIATVPELKEVLRNPVSVIYKVISQIEFRLAELKDKLSRKIIIITGGIGQGKTTQVQKIVASLKEKNIPVGGILCPRIMENGLTIGYDIVDIGTNKREPFLRNNIDEGLQKIGKYSIFPQGLEKGISVLAESAADNCSLVVIDEVGKLELNNQGWSANIAELVNGSSVLLFAVRDSFTEQVIQKWNLKDYSVFTVSDNLYEEVSEMIANHLN
jgi:nucleoside-triphosphatase THEP1